MNNPGPTPWKTSRFEGSLQVKSSREPGISLADNFRVAPTPNYCWLTQYGGLVRESAFRSTTKACGALQRAPREPRSGPTRAAPVVYSGKDCFVNLIAVGLKGLNHRFCSNRYLNEVLFAVMVPVLHDLYFSFLFFLPRSIIFSILSFIANMFSLALLSVIL